MILGKAVGTVVTTISHPHYDNRRLLVIQPLVGEGDEDERAFIAVDHAHAGIGDTVLVNREGNGARDVLNLEGGCIISVIVGIVDSVEISEEVKRIQLLRESDGELRNGPGKTTFKQKQV